MKKVTFLPRAKAEAMAPPENAIIISLTDPAWSPAQLQPGWKDCLRLAFHDEDGRNKEYIPFSEEMAEQVWTFVRKHYKEASELVVHCEHGISRSGAIALCLSEMFGVQCYAGPLPVSFQNYKIYNKHVYRELLIWYGDNEFTP